jgi:FKBP-type peptidyl-prolyl cis-trans isomerase FklB
MKDSTSYTLYNTSAVRGGQSFYYKITKQRDQSSASPALTDMVTVNYRGRLITGDIFETFVGNSPENDNNATPAQFIVNQLIPGWTENLIQMKVGEIRTITVPQTLGYGVYGASLAIPPYSTLRFEIQITR